ncbi:MAG: helix-turn-helix transcriptional regulator [Myxococcales bacterium]|nr:helix-turn-helix transcriptional regulator [Myxococcales bacterium]
MSFAAELDNRTQLEEVPAVALNPALEDHLSEFADRFSLTTRERQLMELLVSGYGTVPVLAKHLDLSPNTVHNHFKNVFRRTRTHSKTGVLALFIQHVTSPSEEPPAIVDHS